MSLPALSTLDSVEISRGPAGLLVRTRTVVEGQDVYLAGHFPGLPIFPGVLFLDVLHRAVAEALGGPVTMAAIRSARFIAPVLGGDEFQMDIEIPDDTAGALTARASCRRSDGTVCATLHAEFRRE